MGKFLQISTELWPLIYVKISFLASILSIIDQFSSNFVYEFNSGKSGLGWEILSNKYRVMALDLC